MENYTFRFPILALLCSVGISIQAQSGPECRNLNLAVELDDSATIRMVDVVPNLAQALPFTFKLLNIFGAPLSEVLVTSPMASIRIAPCPYLNRGLVFQAFNNYGTCEGMLTFKLDAKTFIQGHDTTVYCIDPLIYNGMVGSGPEVMVPCGAPVPSITFVADWVKPMPCIPGNDTAKIIYREYEVIGKDGSRSTGFDTIYVLRLPQISRNNTFCAERDTSYCLVSKQNFGPYLLLPGPAGTPCQRLYLLNPDGSPRKFDAKCGLEVRVDELPFESTCGEMSRYSVEIKQSCFGSPFSNLCPDQDITQNVLTPVSPSAGYWTCDFWAIVLDTTPPTINCGEPLKTFPAGAHGCSAEITLPPVFATDLCGNVVMVKALVDGFGSYQLHKNGTSWTSADLIHLSHGDDTIKVTYEAYDECHNIAIDSCRLIIKDQTVPVAIAAKGVTVSLPSKKVWVNAENFDAGSWDNCDISVLLARRTDWKDACVDLCDSLKIVVVLPGNDTIWSPVLNTGDDAEAYYHNTLYWLASDQQLCNQLLLDAWRYDLMRHATVGCKSTLDEQQFDAVIDTLLGPDADVVQLKQLGGGWAKQVPFSCEDVCTKVKIELLAMDYWCNWSKSWSDALIEDKSPVVTAKEVQEEINISCRIFKDHRYNYGGNDVSIENLVEAIDQGDQLAFGELDRIFGTYQKVWQDSKGDLIDSTGNPLICDIPFIDSMCECKDSLIPTYSYDYQTLSWVAKIDTVRVCSSVDTTKMFSHGALLVNCPDNVHCTQTLWHDLNSCGQGVIYRKWAIWKECESNGEGDHWASDTTYKIQQINIVNPDQLDLGKFTLPPDTVLQACVLEYDPDGSGNVGGGAHPDSIGRPIYLFDDDCSQIGVGYFDKVLELIDTTLRCHVVIRTWCFVDWCEVEEPQSDNWIDNPTYTDDVLKYTQHILICEQLCSLNCSGLRDTAIVCDDIPNDINQLLPLFGTPAIESADTSVVCEFTLQNQIVIDTNECGFGTMTNTWFLVNKCDIQVDSCKEVITLLSDSVTINRRSFYQGDAEPFNCSDSMVLDPVVIMGACPKLGQFTVTNDSPFAESNGNNASGNYDVGIHYVNYTITSDCLDTIYLTDTIEVIDDVNPTVSAFSDPCVRFMEWETDFNSDPLNPAIRTMLAVQGNDNCQLDTILLVDLDSTFFPDAIIRDSVLYTYQWQSRDTVGNLSNIAISTILVSDSCNLNQKNFQYQLSPQDKTDKDNIRVAIESDERQDDRLLNINRSSGGIDEGSFVLYQNRPNPFRTTTTIGFYLPQSTTARIQVYDLTGRSVKTIQGQYAKGYHEVHLQQTELRGKGLFYYRFDSPSYTGMRKMILLE